MGDTISAGAVDSMTCTAGCKKKPGIGGSKEAAAGTSPPAIGSMVARSVGAWDIKAAGTSIVTWAPVATGTAGDTVTGTVAAWAAGAGASATGAAAAGAVIAVAVAGTVAGTGSTVAGKVADTAIGTSAGAAAGKLGATAADLAICDCDGVLSGAASFMNTTGTTWAFKAAAPSSEDPVPVLGAADTSPMTTNRCSCSSSQTPPSDAWDGRLDSSSYQETQKMLVSAPTRAITNHARRFTLRMDA